MSVLQNSIRDTAHSTPWYKTNQLTSLCDTCECMAATFDAHDTPSRERVSVGGCHLSTGHPDKEGNVGTYGNLELLCGRMNLYGSQDTYVRTHPDFLLTSGDGGQPTCAFSSAPTKFLDNDTSTCMQNCNPRGYQCFQECWDDAAAHGRIAHAPKVGKPNATA